MQTTIPVKSKITAEPVARYVLDHISRDSDIEHQLRLKTLSLTNSGMISSSDVGRFLSVLVRSIRADRAIEVGTFTGYTALKIAQALPEHGELICCDVSEEWTSIGQPFWSQAGVGNKIKLHLAPAQATLESLLSTGRGGQFDFAFIDADKLNYKHYYELCLKLIRPGGLIVLDNMLWDGEVADDSVQDPTTVALRELGQKIAQDARVESVLLTVGDGLMLAYKK